jgi:hypothetical protein
MASPACLFLSTSRTTTLRRSVYGDVRYHLRSYLDETGKVRLSGGTDARRRGAPGNTGLPVLPGVGEPAGQVRVLLPAHFFRGQLTAGGFLRDWMVFEGFGRRSERHVLRRSAWVDACARLWAQEFSKFRHYTKTPTVRYNFVLSLDSEVGARLTAAGVSGAEFLERVLERSLSRFLRENGYDPDDRVGYVYGVHMDTEHLHLQISMLARTEKGKVLSLTKMLRDPVRRVAMGFRNPMTRYACEAAVELEREMLGREHVARVPARELAVSLLGARSVAARFGAEKDRKALYSGLEDELVGDFLVSSGCPVDLSPLLFALVRRYAGAKAVAVDAPVDYTKRDEPVLARRMSRLWFGRRFRQLESEMAGLPGFPKSLLPEFRRFWLDARQGAPDDEERGRLESWKRGSVASDIEMELPVDLELMRSEFSGLGEWFQKFLGYLDSLLLTGSWVFYANLGTHELELAVRMRRAAARIFRRELVGLPPVPVKGAGPEKPVAPPVAGGKESGPSAPAPPSADGTLPAKPPGFSPPSADGGNAG